ncbi:MAG: hypothetical protein ACOCUS_01175 [Polyangiales bacterium]
MTPAGGPEPRRFELDVAAERSTGALRVVAALVVLLAAGWVAASDPGLVAGLVAALGALAALGWIAVGARSRRRMRARERWYLEVDRQGLRLARGGAPLEVPWESVESVEVDEERLVLRLRRRGAEPVEIPPVWRGIGLHELGDVLESVRGSARSAPGG